MKTESSEHGLYNSREPISPEEKKWEEGLLKYPSGIRRAKNPTPRTTKVQPYPRSQQVATTTSRYATRPVALGIPVPDKIVDAWDSAKNGTLK